MWQGAEALEEESALSTPAYESTQNPSADSENDSLRSREGGNAEIVPIKVGAKRGRRCVDMCESRSGVLGNSKLGRKSYIFRVFFQVLGCLTSIWNAGDEYL